MQEVWSSNYTIAEFNIKVDLKPKGKLMYRWCCYQPSGFPTKGRHDEVNLKYGDRDISESSLVFPRSKDGGAG